MGDAPGTTISVTSMAAPKDAMRAYEKAQKIKTEKPAEAEKELNKAVQLYPQFAAAWTLLGDIHRQRNDFEDARTEYYAGPRSRSPVRESDLWPGHDRHAGKEMGRGNPPDRSGDED